jgi:hypothetical protein
MHEMEADRLLCEIERASTSVQVKDFIHNNEQESNGGARKGISNPHDSLSNNDAVDLQKGSTPLPHSQSETQIKVVELSRRIFNGGQSLSYIVFMAVCMFLIA